MPTQRTKTPRATPRPRGTNDHLQGFIMSHFNYCPLVWHFCGDTNTKKLERIQFRALRFVFLDFESDYATLLYRAGLPTLELSRKRAILIDVFKNLMHQSPAFMWNSYKPKLINYNLRNTNTLCIPHSKTSRYGFQTLTAYGAKLWSSLPNNIQSCTDLRAVANGPVGPAMAGPIIELVILIFFFFFSFSDRTNNRASHFDFRNLC